MIKSWTICWIIAMVMLVFASIYWSSKMALTINDEVFIFSKGALISFLALSMFGLGLWLQRRHYRDRNNAD